MRAERRTHLAKASNALDSPPSKESIAALMSASEKIVALVMEPESDFVISTSLSSGCAEPSCSADHD
jgi:hypothetical protein